MAGTPSMPAWPDSLDLSEDYLFWVNTITVTYLSKTAEQPQEINGAPQISHVLWNQIKKDRLAADSILQKYYQTFRFARVLMQEVNIVPKENDIIIDDNGRRWKAELVEVLCYQNEDRVHTTKSLKRGLPVG